jgi:hypothetical protein
MAAPPATVLSFAHITPVLRLDVLEAAALWEPVGGFLEGPEATETKAIICTNEIPGLTIGTAAAITTSGGITVDCLYALGLPKPARVHLLAHELGHAFGLAHVPEHGSLMFFQSARDDLPDLADADVNEWYRVHPAAL